MLFLRHTRITECDYLPTRVAEQVIADAQSNIQACGCSDCGTDKVFLKKKEKMLPNIVYSIYIVEIIFLRIVST